MNVTLKGIPTIGDSLRDIKAARGVGAEAYLVRTGKGRRTLESKHLPKGIPVFDDLAEAVENLLEKNT